MWCSMLKSFVGALFPRMLQAIVQARHDWRQAGVLRQLDNKLNNRAYLETWDGGSIVAGNQNLMCCSVGQFLRHSVSLIKTE